MRADQWLMIGVGALGVYAVYRLVQPVKPEEVRPEPEPRPYPQDRGPAPTPVIVPGGALPPSAGPLPPPPPGLSVIQTDPMLLTPAAWYHGRLELAPTATATDVANILSRLGLTDLRVFSTPQEAATDIFQPFALANPGQGTRWFRARLPFTTDSRPVNVPRPRELVLIWHAAPPQVRPNPVISGWEGYVWR